MQARYAIIVLGVAAIAAASGFYSRDWLDQQKSKEPPATSEMQPRIEQPSAVTALGRLVPESEIVNVGAPSGRLEKLEAKEGDVVEQDAILAYLDSHQELLANRNFVRSQLDEAQQSLKAEIELGEASVQKAKANLKFAQEVMSLQIEVQETLLRRSKAELKEANNDLKRSSNLLADKAIAKSQYDDVALVAQQASDHLSHHHKLLKQLEDDRKVKLELAQAELRAARANKTRQQLTTQTQSLAKALDLAEERLKRTVIRAPLRGQILKVLTRAGEIVGHQPILKMGNTESMVVTAEVYETDVGRVRAGQRATIKSGAFPDPLTGHVEEIGRLVYRNDVFSLDPTADADARVIEVRIRLDESEVAARYNNHQVDVEIHIADPAS